MRNSKIVFALVIATIFMLTSCQKDAIEDLDTTMTSTTPSNAPHTEESVFKGEVIAYPKALPAKDLDISLEVSPLEGVAQSRNSTIYLTLGDDPVKIDIDCGQTIRSSTKGNDNLFRNSTYNQLGVNANLNGGDQIYNFFVAQTDIVTIDLTDTRENLAMFLYKGDYDLQRGRVSLRYIRDYTTSTSRWGDHLGPIQLTAGNYILVVDSAPNRESDYTLTIDCLNTTDPCDDMEDYYLGDISPQSSKWEKWSNNSSDGEVRGNGAGQYLMVKRNTNGSQPDLLYKTGRKNSDSYTLSMDMWIFRGKGGYFNIQKQLKHEWGGQVYFYGNGTGEVKINGRSIGFNYPQDTWAKVEIDFDFDYNTTRLHINNQRKATWSIREHSQGSNGSYQIEAVNFYANASNSEMFIDNVCFEKN